MRAYPLKVAFVTLATAFLVAAMPGTTAAAVDEQALIVSVAQTTLGARFQLGANGPVRFDCSGLVWYVYNTAGLGDRIGGRPLRAREFQRWFRDRGLLSRYDARIGDLVFYGNPAKHSGIVTSFNKKGKPRVTSALTSGVRETNYNSLDVPFYAFGHVALNVVPDPTPEPTPTPSPTPTPTPTPTPEASSTPAPAPTAGP